MFCQVTAVVITRNQTNTPGLFPNSEFLNLEFWLRFHVQEDEIDLKIRGNLVLLRKKSDKWTETWFLKGM